jgi:hypothetical protein
MRTLFYIVFSFVIVLSLAASVAKAQQDTPVFCGVHTTSVAPQLSEDYRYMAVSLGIADSADFEAESAFGIVDLLTGKTWYSGQLMNEVQFPNKITWVGGIPTWVSDTGDKAVVMQWDFAHAAPVEVKDVTEVLWGRATLQTTVTPTGLLVESYATAPFMTGEPMPYHTEQVPALGESYELPFGDLVDWQGESLLIANEIWQWLETDSLTDFVITDRQTAVYSTDDIETPRFVVEHEDTAEFNREGFSPNGEYFAVMAQSPETSRWTLTVYSTETGEVLKEMQDLAESFDWTGDSNFIVATQAADFEFAVYPVTDDAAPVYLDEDIWSASPSDNGVIGYVYEGVGREITEIREWDESTGESRVVATTTRSCD